MSILLGKGMLGGLTAEEQIAALLAGDNSWSGLQTFGGGFTNNGESFWGPTATFTYIGGAAAAHRTALGAVGLTGDETIAGIKSFSSTTRPTSSGTGTPESTSLTTVNDSYIQLEHRTAYVNPGFCTAGSQNSGSSAINSNGGWDIITTTSAASGARLSHRIARMLGVFNLTDSMTFDRRMIFRMAVSLSQGTHRAGSQLFWQVGRPVNSVTYVQLAAKGIGFGINNGIVTPFVHNGSIRTDGATFALTARMLVIDWVPGSGLFIYGTGDLGTSTNLTLLSSITTNLPSGNFSEHCEFLLFETGAGTALIRYSLGNLSVTLP